MQNIKFRAWSKLLKKYVPIWSAIETRGDDVLRAINNTFVIEEFTGLKDKNGVEIYENDIVCQQMRFDETNGVIFWQEEKSRFAINLDGFITTITKPQEMSYEVVGNIHENQELLEEG